MAGENGYDVRIEDAPRGWRVLIRDPGGRVVGERPHFEQEERPPHSDDLYTAESVRIALSQLVEKLNAGDT